MASETQTLTPCQSIPSGRGASGGGAMTRSVTSLSPHSPCLPLTAPTVVSMSSHLGLKESGDTVPLTAVPVVFTSEGHMTGILEMGVLAGGDGGHMVGMKHGAEGTSALPVTRSGDFPVLFTASSGGAMDLLGTGSEAKSGMTLLQPIHGATASTPCSPLVFSKAGNEIGSHVLASREMLTVTDSHSHSHSPKSITQLQSSMEVQVVSRTSADLPMVLSGTSLTLTATSDDKPQDIYINTAGKVLCDDHVNSLSANATPTSIPVVLKTHSRAATLPLVLAETGDGMEMDSSTAEKSEISPTSIFPEGAVLVETPQG